MRPHPLLSVTPAAALVLFFVPAAAQTPDTVAYTLTLGDAIALAQERGHQARAADAARDAARYRDRAFSSRLLPQLSLTGDVPAYNRSIIPVLQPDGGTFFRTQQQTSYALGATLSQRLPLTGGDLFVSSALSRLSVVQGDDGIATWSSTPVTVGLRQGILRPNTLKWERREQGARWERDERVHREAMEDIALATASAFFDVYAARVALRTAETNAAVNDTLYRLNTGRYEVGRIGENDLLQSELALLRAQTSLEGARLTYDRALAALRLVLRLPPDTPLEVVVPTEVPDVEADPDRAVEQALRNRSDVSDVELQEVQARRRITEAQLANGIGATVQASVGFNATGDAFRAAYQDLLEARRFTLSVEIPLWQWGAHGEGIRAAEADHDRVASLSEARLEQLALDARFAARELTQARRDVVLRAKADTVADKRFEVAYNRYVIGRITIDNLYIAQNEKDQAVVQFVQALRAYWQAYYRLRRVTLYDFAADAPIR